MPLPLTCSPRVTRRAGSRKGSGRRSTPSTMEKIAVVAPIPKASMSTAVAVKPGDVLSCRNANLRSERSLCIATVILRKYALGALQVPIPVPDSTIYFNLLRPDQPPSAVRKAFQVCVYEQRSGHDSDCHACRRCPAPKNHLSLVWGKTAQVINTQA